MENDRKIGPRRKRFEPEVYDLAQELLNEQPIPSGSEIARRLAKVFPVAPSERAVNDWIARGVIALVDEDGPWAIRDAKTPEEIPLVLTVARWLANFGNEPDERYLPKWPTRALAKEAVKIQRAYPGVFDAATVYILATMLRRGQDRPVATYLAFTPWVDPVPLFDAVNRKLVTPDALIGLAADFSTWGYQIAQQHEHTKEAWAARLAGDRAKEQERRDRIARWTEEAENER